MKRYTLDDIQNAYGKAEVSVQKAEAIYAKLKDIKNMEQEFLFELEKLKEETEKIALDIKIMVSLIEKQLSNANTIFFATEVKNYGTFSGIDKTQELAKVDVNDNEKTGLLIPHGSHSWFSFWKSELNTINSFKGDFLKLINQCKQLIDSIREKIQEGTPHLQEFLRQ